VLSALGAQGKAGALGASAFPALVGGVGSGLGSALSDASGIGSGIASFAGLPYQTGAGIAGNALTGLGNLQNQLSGATNIGNNQFLLPQQVMGDLMQYMGLGQRASDISGNLGQMGFNQTAQGLGGALSGANMLFGNNGMLTGSGGGGLGGLFGGGAASAGDFGGGGAALGVPDALGLAGGGSDAMISSAALPALALS
jgi:hypothetical protein